MHNMSQTPPPPMTDLRNDAVLKVMPRKEWEEAVARGSYSGSALDRADGFIHLSNAHQLAETLEKHYAGHTGLVAIAFSAAALGDALRWEISRNGDKFPHLYGPLETGLAVHVVDLKTGTDGIPRWPTA